AASRALSPTALRMAGQSIVRDLLPLTRVGDELAVPRADARVGVERSEADAERLRLVRMPAPKGRPAARAEGLGEAVGRLVLADQLGPLEDHERTRFQPRLGRGGGTRPALAAGAVAVARGTEGPADLEPDPAAHASA